MDRDKMREEIAIIIHEGFRSDVKAGAMADDVLSLLAPVIEKAAFLDDIIKRTDDKDCYENGWCPLSDTCDGKLWCRDIKKALEVPDGN